MKRLADLSLKAKIVISITTTIISGALLIYAIILNAENLFPHMNYGPAENPDENHFVDDN